MNLRIKPVDKRRLKKEDRGFNTGKAEQALARARQRRGNLAYQRNKPMRTTKRTPGSGGFTQGISIQQDRLRQEGQKRRRAEGFRPESLQGPEDPR